MQKNIMIISATTRPGRMGKPVTEWAERELKALNSKLTYHTVHLDELELPFFDELIPPSQGMPYTNKHTKEWSKMVSDSDGFIIVTAEYNHGYPAPIKNALDYLHKEWAGKPVAFIGYGAGPAPHAIRQLKEVTAFIGMDNIDTSVGIPAIWEAVDQDGNIKPDAAQGSLEAIDAALTSRLEA